MKSRLWPPMWIRDACPLRELTKHLRLIAEKFQNDGLRGVIVDFGCGDLPYKPLFEAFATQYIGCDLPGSEADVIFTPNETIPLQSSIATCVMSFQVLEHVSDPSWYLSEAHRMLREDGALLLSTHGTWPYHPHPCDFRRWTRSGLILDIEKHGFVVVDAHSILGPVAWIMLFPSMAIGATIGAVPIVGTFLSGIWSFIANSCISIANRLTPTSLVTNNAAIYLILAKKAKAL